MFEWNNLCVSYTIGYSYHKRMFQNLTKKHVIRSFIKLTMYISNNNINNKGIKQLNRMITITAYSSLVPALFNDITKTALNSRNHIFSKYFCMQKIHFFTFAKFLWRINIHIYNISLNFHIISWNIKHHHESMQNEFISGIIFMFFENTSL
jgi:hypothetical protein